MEERKSLQAHALELAEAKGRAAAPGGPENGLGANYFFPRSCINAHVRFRHSGHGLSFEPKACWDEVGERRPGRRRGAKVRPS